MIDIEKCKSTLEEDVRKIVESLPEKTADKTLDNIKDDINGIMTNTLHLCSFVNNVLEEDNRIEEIPDGEEILKEISVKGIKLIDQTSLMNFNKLVQMVLDLRHKEHNVEGDLDPQRLVIDNNIRYTSLCFTGVIPKK